MAGAVLVITSGRHAAGAWAFTCQHLRLGLEGRYGLSSSAWATKRLAQVVEHPGKVTGRNVSPEMLRFRAPSPLGAAKLRGFHYTSLLPSSILPRRPWLHWTPSCSAWPGAGAWSRCQGRGVVGGKSGERDCGCGGGRDRGGRQRCVGRGD